MTAKSKSPAPRSSKKDAEFEDLLRRAAKFQKRKKHQLLRRRRGAA